MVDLKKASDELTTKAAFTAAKNAATRAIEDALATDEERAQRKAEEAALAKKKRTKLIVLGVVGLLLVLGVIGFVVSYWHWFLLAGILGLVALYGRYRWRERRRAPPASKGESKARVKVERAVREPPRVPDAGASEVGPSIEDELAELKARLDK